ncbi:hypothetical protein K1719_002971 [Acacia pycnantha]|nr:hypothetical protein K1719_002971 [Acacia pycnantha]
MAASSSSASPTIVGVYLLSLSSDPGFTTHNSSILEFVRSHLASFDCHSFSRLSSLTLLFYLISLLARNHDFQKNCHKVLKVTIS